jgi:hypothetical protein
VKRAKKEPDRKTKGDSTEKANQAIEIQGQGERAKIDILAEIEKSYRPFPKQKAFHDCTAKYRLFGGAAGPGKSKALLMEAIFQAQKHERADTLLLRRTFPELESSLLSYLRRDIPRDLYESYNETKHVVKWWNGSTTKFGYCRAENDVYQYQGAEFLFIGVDELTLFTLKQWQFLSSRTGRRRTERFRAWRERPIRETSGTPG